MKFFSMCNVASTQSPSSSSKGTNVQTGKDLSFILLIASLSSNKKGRAKYRLIDDRALLTNRGKSLKLTNVGRSLILRLYLVT